MIVYSTLYYLWLTYVCYGLVLVPVMGAFQESKVWAARAVPSISLFGHVKVFLLTAFWVLICFVGTLLLVPRYVASGFDSASVEHSVSCLVERITGITLLGLFVGPVQVRGRDKLPPLNNSKGSSSNSGQRNGYIFIANHSSTLDSAASYFLFRKFKWVAKKSILYMPGVGNTMLMGGHILLDRKSKYSKRKMFDDSHNLLRSGGNLFLFPQGTRCLGEWLPLRDGAFTLALEGGYDIVPLSFEIPKSAWNSWYPINILWRAKVDPIVITVHPVIPVKKVESISVEDKNALKNKCEEVILSALPHFKKLRDN